MDVVNDPALLQQLGDPISASTLDVPFMTRAKAAIKATPEGKQGYLESVYGKGNVSRQGEEWVIKEGGKWKLFDEKEVTLNDVADMAGGVLDTGPAIAAGFATANPVAVGAAGAAGNLLRQTVSAQIPGDDQMSLSDRAISAGKTGLIEGGIQKGVNVASKVFDKTAGQLRPHNIVARIMSKNPSDQYAKQGENLEEWMRRDVDRESPLSFGDSVNNSRDFDFTWGQQTGSRAHLTLEGVGRRHVMTMNAVAEIDRKQIAASVQKYNSIMDGIGGSKSAAVLGDEIKEGMKRVSSDLIRGRSQQGKVDFSKAWLASKGEKNIPTIRLKQAYDELMEDFTLPGASGGTDALGAQLTKMTKDIEGNIDARLMQGLLARWGKVAAGNGNVFPLHEMDKAAQRAFAGKVTRALKADLDDAIAIGVNGSKSLKVARDNWAVNTGAIDELKNTAIGRYLKSELITPEVVVDKILKMRPSELVETSEVLKRVDPALYATTKRKVMETWLDNSKTPISVSDAVAGTVDAVSSSKLATHIRNNADEIEAFFGKGEAAEMSNMLEVLSRLSDRAKTEGSATGTFNIVMQTGKDLISLSPERTFKAGLSIMTPKKLVAIVSDPEARKAVMAMKETKTWTKGAIAASIYLNVLYGDGDESPMRPLNLLEAQQMPPL